MKIEKRNVFFVFRTAAFIFALLSFFTFPCFAEVITEADQLLFQEANQEYKLGNYEKAAAKYQIIADKYPNESAFQYNLGNSLFRLEIYGRAILAYERAKVSDPRSKDIRDNLKYANDILEYRMEDKRNWYVQKGDELLMYVRTEEAYLLMAVTLCLLLMSWVFAVSFKSDRPWGWFRKTLLVLFVLSLIIVVLKHIDKSVIRDAIIVAKEADVRYGPSVEDQVAFTLGEGLKVYVIDTRETWSRVILSNKETGWMKNSEIAKV